MSIDFKKRALELKPKRMEQIRALQGICAMINLLQSKCDADMQEMYNKLLTQAELTLQHAWGILESPNYHTWWMKSEACTCPKTDNMERWGTNAGFIHTEDCPVHGIKTKEAEKVQKTKQPVKAQGRDSKGRFVKTEKNSQKFATGKLHDAADFFIKTFFENPTKYKVKGK